MSSHIVVFDRPLADCIDSKVFKSKDHENLIKEFVWKCLSSGIKTKKVKYTEFPGSQPASLLRKDFGAYVTNPDLMFIQKTDGIRMKFYALKVGFIQKVAESSSVSDHDQNRVPLFVEEPKVGEQVTAERLLRVDTLICGQYRNGDMVILTGIGVPEKYFPLIMDGELIGDEFQVFGIDMVNGFSCHNFNESARVHCYSEVVKNIHIKSAGATIIQTITAKPKYLHARDYMEALKHRRHKLDGLLVGINSAKSVPWGTDPFLKKIKDEGSNSIDLLVRRSVAEPHKVVLLKMGYLDKRGSLKMPKAQDGSVQMFVEGEQDIFKTFGFTEESEWNNVVWEFEWDRLTNIYTRSKSRLGDKDSPNTALTVHQTKMNVNEVITPQEFLDAWIEHAEVVPAPPDLPTFASKSTMSDRQWLDQMTHRNTWDTMTNAEMQDHMRSMKITWLNDPLTIHSIHTGSSNVEPPSIVKILDCTGLKKL